MLAKYLEQLDLLDQLLLVKLSSFSGPVVPR